MDGLLLAAGLAINFEIWLRFRHGQIPPAYLSLYFHVVIPIVFIRLALYQAFGLYRSIARHAGNYELMLIAGADTLATAIIIVLNAATALIPSLGDFPLDSAHAHLLRMPWGIVFNDWMLALITTAGVRLLRRELAARFVAVFMPTEGKRVVIVGAGDAGEQVGRDLAVSTKGAFHPVAYVDPNPAMVGHKIHGLPVIGGLEDLPVLIGSLKADEIVIALDRPTPRVLNEIIVHCQSVRVGIKIVPPLTSVMTGGVAVSTLRPVEIEDLLGREPVNLTADNRPAYLQSKRVLITGGGGSIGRELCRQALTQKPQTITLLGRGENSLFEASLELSQTAQKAGVELKIVVGDIRDEAFIRELFARLKPQVVFHAAAHKHVHLMEEQACEAVKNNIWGTSVVARAALESGAERFINISTDKAVHPSGVMGQTKRVAEMIVSAISRKASGAFLSVRFGNVLGSRGSVVPTFRRQIEQGGPVTVTHPDATRYFMTTAEAVSLVIQAGAQGRGGELFLLDMGKPVRIADLARSLIILSGLEPETDIPIQFTGLRPGEKLNEELLTEGEGVSATENGKIFITRNEAKGLEELEPMLNRLFDAARNNDEAMARGMLKGMVQN